METSKQTESLSDQPISISSESRGRPVFSIGNAKQVVDCLRLFREGQEGTSIYQLQLRNLIYIVSNLLDDWETGRRPLPNQEESRDVASIYGFMTTAKCVPSEAFDVDSECDALKRFHEAMFRLIPYLN